MRHEVAAFQRELLRFGLCLIMLLACAPQVVAQDALWRSYYTAAQKAYQQGELGESESLLRTALGVTSRSDESLSTYYYLAHICVRRENYSNAEEYFHILLDGLGTKTWAVLRPPDGTPEWEQDSVDVKNTSDSKQFLSILSKKPPQLLSVRLAKPITIVDVLSDYGSMLQLTHRYDESEKAFRQALLLSDCRPDQATHYEMKLMQRLAILYRLQGRAAEEAAVIQQMDLARNAAVPNFDQMLTSTIKGLDRFGHNSNSLAIRLNNLALFCATHGDYAKAQDLFDRALSALDEHPNRHKKERRIIVSNYSDLLLAMGRVTEANNLVRKMSAPADPPSEAVSDNPARSSGY